MEFTGRKGVNLNTRFFKIFYKWKGLEIEKLKKYIISISFYFYSFTILSYFCTCHLHPLGITALPSTSLSGFDSEEARSKASLIGLTTYFMGLAQLDH